MAAKGSYFGKLRAGGQGQRLDLPKVDITPEDQARFTEGQVILIDKDIHWTSFDVIRKLRNLIRIKKIGHAGTLDPLASGLLIICTGKFTKKINEFMMLPKEYTGSFTLGAITPTYDLESHPEQEASTAGIDEEKLQSTARLFSGDLLQKPPVYSAIKKDGTAAYELARRGEDVDLQARPITVYEFEITGAEMPVVYFRVKCSTGTYIRSLAHDYGQALGCGAYLSSLRRTRVGDFNVADADSLLSFAHKLKERSQ